MVRKTTSPVSSFLSTECEKAFKMRLLMALICGCFVATACEEDAKPSKPSSRTEKQIEGWTVKVDDRLLSGVDTPLGTGSRLSAP